MPPPPRVEHGGSALCLVMGILIVLCGGNCGKCAIVEDIRVVFYRPSFCLIKIQSIFLWVQFLNCTTFLRFKSVLLLKLMISIFLNQKRLFTGGCNS